MSQSASQAAQFYQDVAKSKQLWTIADAGGYPAPMTPSGQRSMPFWSTRARAERIIATVPAYYGFEPEELSWSAFVENWAPGLEEDGLLVGVNWSGANATGYDIKSAELVRNVQAEAERISAA